MHTNQSVIAPSDKWGGIYPWYVVAILMFAQTFSFIDRMIMGLLVEPIRAAFSISDTQFSLLAGFAFAVFYAIMGIPLARIADSRSRRGLIAFGIALWSIMTALCGLAKSYWWLFLARVGVGVGEAALSPAAYSLISDYFKKSNLAKALSVYTVGVTLGSGLAYMIGGQVVAWAKTVGELHVAGLGVLQGWQLTFLMVGIPGLIIALLMFTVIEPPRQGLSDAAAQRDGAVPFSQTLRYLKSHGRAYASHMLGMAIFIMVVYSLNIWGPSYLIRTFAMAPSEAGLKFGVIMMFAGTAGLLTGGSLADKHFSAGTMDAYSRVITISAALALPCIIALGFVDSDWQGMAALAVAIFFTSFQGGIAGGVVSLMTPNEMRSQLVAVHFLTSNLIGLGFGPTVVAATTDYVFMNDAALGQSLALTAAVLCPIAIVIMRLGMPRVRAVIEGQMASS